uniref:Hflx-type G domain-containing protein n=1 Tax=Lepeophtheirus salmonis TaxID=72036 RepID=A0A0K2T7J5_LEPSM
MFCSSLIRICRAPRNIYFKGQVFGFHYKYAVHNFFKVNFSSTVNNEGFRDVLFDLNLYEDVESEAQKYKELLSRYCLYDISTTQNIFFVHPYLNTTDEEKVNDRKELEEESVQLLQTLKWEVPGRIALPVQSLSRKVVFQYNQIKQIRECILRDTSVKYAGIFINKDTLFYGHRIELQRELFDLNVFDRYSVVLQIFKQHAQTREAKLQVSLAEIPYVRHRLRGDHALELENKHSKSRQGESYFHHHMMELKKRENKIKKELCRLKEQRSYLRRSRFKLGLPSIAVVGYTNSGKTSLIKSLTGSDKLTPEDKFFATLDVTLHGGYLPQSHQKVLYIDTVGFISDIPVNLIASFASTLEDALHADLLIHVRDISHPDHERQNKIVEKTLQYIFKGTEKKALKNMIVVYNKVDKIEMNSLMEIISSNAEIFPVSATRYYGMQSLSTLIEKRTLEISGRQLYTFRVKNGGKEYQWIRVHFPITEEIADEKDFNYIFVKTMIKKSDFNKFRSHFVS